MLKRVDDSAPVPERGQSVSVAGSQAPAPPPHTIASFSALMTFIREDRATNRGFWTPGFQALATYRLGVWARTIHSRFLRAPVRVLYAFLNLIMCNVYGIQISPQTRIGRRFRIVHQHGIVIHRSAVIGDDCRIRHGVTIGGARGPGAPRLGDRVEVGAGAILVGRIVIGDDVTVGPNAVVTTNVPAGAIVASPQSRIFAPPPRRAAPRG